MGRFYEDWYIFVIARTALVYPLGEGCIIYESVVEILMQSSTIFKVLACANDRRLDDEWCSVCGWVRRLVGEKVRENVIRVSINGDGSSSSSQCSGSKGSCGGSIGCCEGRSGTVVPVNRIPLVRLFHARSDLLDFVLVAHWLKNAQHASHGRVGGGSEQKRAHELEDSTPIQVTHGLICQPFLIAYTRVLALIIIQHWLDEFQAERVSIQRSSYCKVELPQGSRELC